MILKNLGNEKITPFVQKTGSRVNCDRKRRYDYFMLKEIFEQPDTSSIVCADASIYIQTITIGRRSK